MSAKVVTGDCGQRADDAQDRALAAVEARAAHEAAAVVAGTCPEHRIEMYLVDTEGGEITGHCPVCCRYWWYDDGTGRIGSADDDDPGLAPAARRGGGDMSPPKIIYDDRLVSYLAEQRDEERQAQWAALYAHDAEAVCAGICPAHRSELHPVEMKGCEIAGHCSRCGKYWWYDDETAEVGSAPDHNPFTGAWRPPYRGMT